MTYIFVAVMFQSDVSRISMPINLPDRFSAYKTGRALMNYNVTAHSAKAFGGPLEIYTNVMSTTALAQTYFNQPTATADQTKEQLDAFFETWHSMTWDPVNLYSYSFSSFMLPYFPFFSKCYGYDRYMPIWMVLENDKCEMPKYDAVTNKQWKKDSPQDKRFKEKPLPNYDYTEVVGPFDFLHNPVADWCELEIECEYEEILGTPDNTNRWFEMPTGSYVFEILRYPVDYYQYTGRLSTSGPDRLDGGGAVAIDAYLKKSADNFIKVNVDHTLGDAIPGCTTMCFAREYEFEMSYYQVTKNVKRLVEAVLKGKAYDLDPNKKDYKITIAWRALNWFELLLTFAFDVYIYLVIFCMVGGLLLIISFVAWLVNRLTTHLVNPPDFKIFSLLQLVVPPPLAGVLLAVVPIYIYVCIGNLLVWGVFFIDPQTLLEQMLPVGTTLIEVGRNGSMFTDQYFVLTASVSNDVMLNDRNLRTGHIFIMVGGACLFAGNCFYYCKKPTKREREIALKLEEVNKLPEREDLWIPLHWQMMNFMFTSLVTAMICICIIEYSYSATYFANQYPSLIVLFIFIKVFEKILGHQLRDAMLIIPCVSALEFFTQFITFGAREFSEFILGEIFLFTIGLFELVYLDDIIFYVYKAFKSIYHAAIDFIIYLTPKYLKAAAEEFFRPTAEGDDEKERFAKREVTGVDLQGHTAESVEPIIEMLGFESAETARTFYMPFWVRGSMNFRGSFLHPRNRKRKC
jgi:hypothetical protein